VDGRIIAAAALAALAAGWVWLMRRPAKRALAPRGAKMLFVGDSMLEGLEPRLRARAAAAGVAYTGKWKRGARIATWAGEEDLRLALQQGPSACVIVLGTNDAALADPGAERDELRTLVLECSEATGVPVLWIDPPQTPFDGDAALMQMLAEASSTLPMRRFATRDLDLVRAGDGIHLTMSAYGQWADAIWRWMEAQRVT